MRVDEWLAMLAALLKRSAILQIGRNLGCPERMIANGRADACSVRTALDHGIRIGLGQGTSRKLFRPALDGLKQWRPGRILQACGFDIVVKVGLKRMVAGQFDLLAPLFMQPHR